MVVKFLTADALAALEPEIFCPRHFYQVTLPSLTNLIITIIKRMHDLISPNYVAHIAQCL
jgi:hypothetical protein